ncbi:type VI secretion system contractile sheath large subunit [Sphingomonas bacterium]|uniref:type VI secretion system contractile sheath large subunit n=1 Tax=Sphingomonas bacterium TaxID=1895847 RepID=UPI001576A60A|nr:type VI secretion system contractile sheath large subunit [Sphingomonas bacterium]
MATALAAEPEARAGAVGDVLLAALDDGTFHDSLLDPLLAPGGGQDWSDWFDGAPSRTAADRLIARIDQALSEQVDAILAHPRFAALEAAWRGVRWLTSGLDVDGASRIRVLDARWTEVARDFDRAAEFDRSALFDLLYAQEFDMPGGVPFSLLVGLYAVQHRPARGHPTDDVEVLRHLSQACAAAFAPIVVDAAPGLFGVDRLAEMDLRQTLAADFRNPAYTRLRGFQARPDSRFVGIATPPIRLRGPRRGRQAGDCGWAYEADEHGSLWGGAALAVAHVALRAFNDYRWPATVRGLVRDELTAGLVATLPLLDVETDAPKKFVKPPLEVQLSETLDRELADAGVICVRRVKDTPYLAIHNLPSAHKPTTIFDTEVARTNQQLGTMLNYILCVSRFAHYLKVIGREWIGSAKSAEECETRLQRWIGRYVSSGTDLTFEQKARYPLQEGRISVAAMPGSPGSYQCQVALKPHFQLDQAISEFHLTTVLRDPGAA